MELALILAAVVLVVALLAWAVTWAQKTQRRREDVWREIAAARGGVFREGEAGFFKSVPASIEAPVGHAVVFVDTYVVSSGNSSTTYTRVRARFAIGAGPVFRVYEEGFFQTLGKALGTQDVELGGYPAFDDAYVVKCDEPELTRRAWTDRAKRLMLEHPRKLTAESDGRDVKIVAVGALDDPSEVGGMMDLASELASLGGRELARLAGETGGRVSEVRGPWEAPGAPALGLSTPRGEALARVTPSTLGLQLVLPHEREGLEAAVDVEHGRADGLPKGVLTEAAPPLLAKVGRARLTIDAGRARLAWATIPDAATLTAGAALLAEIAGGSRSLGAFR